MTTEIVLALIIVFCATILFMSCWLGVGVVALVVLSSLVLTQLVTPIEALSGFINPAVITVWAVFILSGGLSKTGIAGQLGTQVLLVAGNAHIRFLLLIMASAAAPSAFMNNVGVAALMLPVSIEIARKTKTPPSKLILPMAIGTLLGGLLILIGKLPITLAMEPGGNRFLDYTKLGTPLKLLIFGIAMLILPLVWPY